MAAGEELRLLAGRGYPELCSRLVDRELGRAAYPDDEWRRWFIESALCSYAWVGMLTEERDLAERARAELQPVDCAFIAQWMVVAGWRSGDADETLRWFATAQLGADPLYRETLEAAAGAYEKVGEMSLAADLRERASSAPSSEHILYRANAWTGPPATTGQLPLSDELVGRYRPRVDWRAVLSADLTHGTRWFFMALAVLILSIVPVERFVRPAWRQLGGAALLCLPRLATFTSHRSVAMGLSFAFPLTSVRAALSWSTLIVGLLLAGMVASVVLVEGQHLRLIGWRRSRKVRGGVVAALALTVVFTWGSFWDVVHRPLVLLRIMPVLLLTCGLTSAAAALGEETLFRGYMMKALMRVQPRFWVANVAQALMFGLVHLVEWRGVYGGPDGAWLHSLGAWVLMALVFGWLARGSRSLWPAGLLHFMIDFVGIFGAAVRDYEAWYGTG